MAPSVQQGSVVVPAMPGATTQRPASQRLPIIPAIPRKFEKQPRKTSSLAAGFRSVTNTPLEPPASHPIVRHDKSLHVGGEGRPDNDPHTNAFQHLEGAGNPSVEGSCIKDNAKNMATATVVGTTIATETPPPVVSFSPPSVLDPESPPFVPVGHTSKTPTETLDGTSSLDGNPSDPQAPYPIQTTAPPSWAPYETTSPDHSVQSPMQPTYAAYGQPAPLFYAPTVFHNDKYPNPSMYYGYDSSRNISFYPQSSRSYVSASPIQSSYEGYAMANTPQAIHSRAVSYSHPHITTSAEKAHGPSAHTPSQLQSQNARPIPQFGNHFPITPSATPSNSGSQKQDPSPTNAPEQTMPAGHGLEVGGGEKAVSASTTSQEYQEWCNQIMGTLHEEAERSEIPRTLSQHLISNFNNPAFADCELYISHVSHRFEPAVVSLHSLLIAQNPKLHALLQGAEMREDGKKQMLLNVNDEYAEPAALKAAVRVCYGERHSLYTGYPGDLTSEPEVSNAWMKNALAFAAAGHLLEMTGVAHRGEQIASMVLNWDNLQQALSFAMDSRVQRAWGSPTSSASFPCNASELLLSCLYFIVSNVAASIRLDFTAKSLSSIDRLPTIPESETPSSKARLSRIQFGDLPVGTEEPISKQDTLTSAILFSLPFEHFKFILDRVQLSLNLKIANHVVQERERRRVRTLNTITNMEPPEIQLNPSLTQEERIQEKEGRLSLDRA